MKLSGYSVGISDLIMIQKQIKKLLVLLKKKKDVQNLIDQLHLGV